MPIALTRPVPPGISRCELTHLNRAEIDHSRAAEQHRRYEDALTSLGCAVRRIRAAPELPDSVFVEDTAVVLPEIAVIARPGAESRRTEVSAVADVLGEYRSLARIQPPGTLDGGDVLRVGSRIYVGRSNRTNAAGIFQLRELLSPLAYEIREVEVRGYLHLKTAVTLVRSGAVLLNPGWIDPGLFDGVETFHVDEAEPFAANALLVGETVLFPAAFPRTRERLEQRGVHLREIEADELAKAEAGLTCCSILIEA